MLELGNRLMHLSKLFSFYSSNIRHTANTLALGVRRSFYFIGSILSTKYMLYTGASSSIILHLSRTVETSLAFPLARPTDLAV